MRDKHVFLMHLADEWASRSRCLSRQVGAVLVTPDGTQIGAGYNGPPRGVPHCDTEERWAELVTAGEAVREDVEHGYCPRRVLGFSSGKGLHICPAAHAEQNALVNAAREGISTKGLHMYTQGVPCQECAKLIVNAGVTKVFCYSDQPPYDERALWILEWGRVELVRVERRVER